MSSRTEIPVCPFLVKQVKRVERKMQIFHLSFATDKWQMTDGKSAFSLESEEGQIGMPVLQRHRPTRVIVGPVGRENRKAPA